MFILFAEIDRSHSGDTEKDSCFRSTGLFQTKSSQLYEFEKDSGDDIHKNSYIIVACRVTLKGFLFWLFADNLYKILMLPC
jgi:hypothetical protein